MGFEGLQIYEDPMGGGVGGGVVAQACEISPSALFYTKQANERCSEISPSAFFFKYLSSNLRRLSTAASLARSTSSGVESLGLNLPLKSFLPWDQHTEQPEQPESSQRAATTMPIWLKPSFGMSIAIVAKASM